MNKTVPVILVALMLSCIKNNSGLESGEAGHEDHVEIMLQSTLFTDSVEFFIEYPVLVRGEEAVFAIHVTRLSNYKPFALARVTAEMKGIRAVAEESEIPGIYMVSIHPAEAGKFPVSITLAAGNRIEQVSDSVKVYESDDQAMEQVKETASAGVVFTKEQAWDNDFMIQEIVEQQFSSVIPASGEILAMPGEKQNVSASSAGIVLFATKNLVQGRRVDRGQLLFTIVGKDITQDNVGAKIEASHNRYLQSKSEYDRHLKLYREKIISEKQFYETQMQYRTDSTTWFALSASAVSGGMKVVAPLTGYLHELNVSEGQYISAGNLLATISTNEILLLRADVSQQYYPLLDQIETARFRPAYGDKTYAVDELKGRLLAKGASVAENNHYIPVYFEVKNDGSLLEGAFAEFWLITGKTKSSRIVPLSALLEEQGTYYVFLQTSGDHFYKQRVITGSSDGVFVEIAEGLKSGDRIVTKGAMLLKAVSMSSAMPADTHQH